MQGFLTNAFKHRLIYDLRLMMDEHPEYKNKVQVIPRFPFKDRPPLFIRVFGTSTNLQRLDPSNHLGFLESHVQLLKLEHKPGIAIEWVKEDTEHLDNLVAPGMYYIDFVEDHQFMIDPLYEVEEQLYREYETGKSSPNFTLAHHPVVGFVDMRRGELSGADVTMEEGKHYTLDRLTGTGTILETLPSHSWDIEVRYWTPGQTEGPVSFKPNTAHNEALPGVILALGRRARKGDKQVVRVYREREQVADALGGKWELGMDFEFWALDPDAVCELSDFVALMLWGRLLQRYTTEGIALTQFDFGGEAEEVYDELTEQTWFMSQAHIGAFCDWEIAIARPFTFTGFTGLTMEGPGISSKSGIVMAVGRPMLVSHSADLERIL